MKLRDRTTTWSDKAVATLAACVAAGMSASQAAAELGDCTRMAALGKAARLGLKFKGSHPRVRKEVAVVVPDVAGARRFVPAVPDVEYVEPAVFLAPPPATAKPWLQRQDGECCFPVSGDGATTLFCCAPADRRGYCTEHRAVLYGKKAA